MKRRKVTVAVLSVVLAAAALTGCGSAQQTNGPKKTRVVLNEVAHSVFYAPMYVAIEEGYFEDAGIDLELVTGFGADKTMTAVLTGEADIGFMGSGSTIYTYAGGTEVNALVDGQIRCRIHIIFLQDIFKYHLRHTASSTT